MITQAILHDLATAGVILSADGDRLDVDGPDAALTDDLLATLRERKAELLELLAGGQARASALEADEGGPALLAMTERIRLKTIRLTMRRKPGRWRR